MSFFQNKEIVRGDFKVISLSLKTSKQHFFVESNHFPWAGHPSIQPKRVQFSSPLKAIFTSKETAYFGIMVSFQLKWKF